MEQPHRGKASGCHRLAQGSWEQAGMRTFMGIEAGVGERGRAGAAPRCLEGAPWRQLLRRASHGGKAATAPSSSHSAVEGLLLCRLLPGVRCHLPGPAQGRTSFR